jgi:hypothetical protein
MDETDTNVRRLRGSRRFRLYMSTVLRAGADEGVVHLLDLSVSGALMTGTRPPAVGTRVYLRLLGGAHAARVVRRDGKQFAVAFAKELSAADVAALVAAGEEEAAEAAVA